MEPSQPSHPFVSTLQINKLQKLQFLVMSLTIAPIRLVLAFIVLVMTWLLGMLFTLGIGEPTIPETPATPFRRFLFAVLQKLGRFVLFILGVFYVQIKGKRANYSEAPILAVASHTSFLDAILWFITAPMPSVLSKYENSKLPIFGTLIKALQPIFVKRDDPKSRENTKLALQQRISTPGDWPQIIIFPEGTCTNGKYMMRLKAGAFLCGASVQPVVIKFNNAINTTAWTECSPHALKLVWLCMCQFYMKCEVHYLPIYKPNQEEIDNPKLYADNVRIVLGTNLGLPFSDHSYEDRMLVRQANKLKFPSSEAAVKFFDIRSKLKSINFATVRDIMLPEFASMASNGHCTIEDLSGYLEIPSNSALKHLFDIYATPFRNSMKFKDYIFGYHHVCSEIHKPENMDKCFKIFSTAKEQSNNELAVIISTIKSKISDSNNDPEKVFKDFITHQPNYGMLLLFFNDISDKATMAHSHMQLRKRKN